MNNPMKSHEDGRCNHINHFHPHLLFAILTCHFSRLEKTSCHPAMDSRWTSLSCLCFLLSMTGPRLLEALEIAPGTFSSGRCGRCPTGNGTSTCWFHQTWLAGKSSMNGGFTRKIIDKCRYKEFWRSLLILWDFWGAL